MSTEDQFGGPDETYDTLVNQIMKQTSDNAAIWNIDPLVIAVGQPLLDVWNKKYGITKTKTTSNTSDREKTDLARVNLTKWMRKYVKVYIYENDSMDDGDVSACGLKPHKTTKTKIGKPATVPLMAMQAGNPPNIKSFYRQQPDAKGVKKRGKPEGVARVETAIFICLPLPPDDKGVIAFAVPPDSADDYGRIDDGTRTPMILPFKSKYSGLIIYTCSRWVTATGIKGDWSAPQSFRIP